LILDHRQTLASAVVKGVFFVLMNLTPCTGKELSSPRHPIDRLVDDRRAYIEAHGRAPLNKWPTDQLNSLIDQWIEFMDKYNEAEAAERALKPPPRPELRIRHKGKTVGRKESPILPPGSNKRPRQEFEPAQPPRQVAEPARPRPEFENVRPRLEVETPVPGPRPRAQSGHQADDNHAVEDDQVVHLLDAFLDENDDVSRSGGPTAKRPRHDARGAPQRVIVEGGMSKQDWMDVISQVAGQVVGNAVGQASAAIDPRITALESKVDSLIETTKRTHQLLVQLLRNQAKRGGVGAVNADAQVNGDAAAASQSVPP
jgi:hypothetical protein